MEKKNIDTQTNKRLPNLGAYHVCKCRCTSEIVTNFYGDDNDDNDVGIEFVRLKLGAINSPKYSNKNRVPIGVSRRRLTTK
ncbi:hypothetical protein BLOT_013383 [Blomia tropicalis]|nr:hypothetical protein BLOT_013383 [Blomia tropicalis]